MNDVREYLEFLDDRDRLTRLSGVDWNLEIGAISDIARKNDLRSAILFEDIGGYDEGRVLTNMFDSPLQASLALGYEPTSSMREAVVTHKEHISTTETEEVRTVSSGPVMENVKEGDEIDLLEFPVPKWHKQDGGRYIGTGDVTVTRNANTGTLNAATYRVQVHGPRTATVYISPGKDGKINKDSYLEQDEPVPVVVSVGQAPDLFCTVNHRLPSDVNELEYASARRRDGPLEVIEGEATGLPIPSRAELVLEGHIYPDDEPVTEGPFGEWTGYYGSGTNSERPLSVERVYHRDDPIITGSNNAVSPTALSVIRSASVLWNELEEIGIPGLGEVNSFMQDSYFRVISIEQQYAGHSTQVGMQSISLPSGAYHGRFTVVVDDDIDVFDWEEVKWAMTTRCDPKEDIHIIEDCWSTFLDPRIPPDRKEEGDLTNSRAVIDATRPYHWRDEFPDAAKISRELEQEMLETYGEELFGSNSPGPD